RWGLTASPHRPAAPSLLLGRQQIELRHAFAHPAPEGHPVLAGAAEMDARIDARIRALARRLREARERPGDYLDRLPARDGETGLISAQHAGERNRCRRAERALRRRVVRDRRRVLIAVPGGITGRRVVAVAVALANGRDRAPEVVDVTDLPAGDVRVGHR